MTVITFNLSDGTTKRLDILEKIGAGASSKVYKVYVYDYGYMALKEQTLSPYIIKELKTQISIAKILKSDNEYAITLQKIIIKENKDFSESEYIGICDTMPETKVYSLYTFIDGPNLGEIVKRNREEGIVINSIVAHKYVRDLLIGLKEIHSYGICHKDIKPDNIMLSSGKLKYIDFGFSCFSDKCMNLSGTPQWAPPEIFIRIKEKPEDWLAGDVFSLGLVILYMLTFTNAWKFRRGENPIREMSLLFEKKPQHYIVEIVKDAILLGFHKYSMFKIYKILVTKMTEVDIKERWNINQCVEYFDSIKEISV